MRIFSATFVPADTNEGCLILADSLANAKTLAADVTSDVPGAVFAELVDWAAAFPLVEEAVMLVTPRAKPASPINWEFVPEVYGYAFMQTDEQWYVSDQQPKWVNSAWVVPGFGSKVVIPLIGFTSTARNSLYQRPE